MHSLNASRSLSLITVLAAGAALTACAGDADDSPAEQTTTPAVEPDTGEG